jgi:hypothetical protein
LWRDGGFINFFDVEGVVDWLGYGDREREGEREGEGEEEVDEN